MSNQNFEPLIVRTPASEALGELLSTPFILLLVSSDDEDRRAVSAATPRLINKHCLEVCCVGENARELEDEVDFLIESDEAFEIVTTSFTDHLEAAEYLATTAKLNCANVVAIEPLSTSGFRLVEGIQTAFFL